MLSFKDYITENRIPKKTPEEEWENAKKSKLPTSSRVNGWDIVTTTHARSRAVERQDDKNPEEWEELHHRMTKHLDHKDNNPVDHKGVYFSKQLNHGYAVSVGHRKRKIHIINVLDNGKHRATHEGDREVIMESVVIDSIEYKVIFID